ncbi:hypothetical protein GCM10020370_11010 [Paenibacillus hodogayensis]
MLVLITYDVSTVTGEGRKRLAKVAYDMEGSLILGANVKLP